MTTFCIFLMRVICVTCFLFNKHAFAQNVDTSRLLVPRIDQENFQLTPEANGKYSLAITLLDGSERRENVQIVNPDTQEAYFQLMGEINELFSDGATAVTIYEAGINGYTVKYRYQGLAAQPLSASAAFLKSSAG